MCPWQTHILRNVSHWAEIGFWCSINHKQRKTKDIYSMGDGERNGADIMSHSVWIQLRAAIAEWTSSVGCCVQTRWRKLGRCAVRISFQIWFDQFVHLLKDMGDNTERKGKQLKCQQKWLLVMGDSPTVAHSTSAAQLADPGKSRVLSDRLHFSLLSIPLQLLPSGE